MPKPTPKYLWWEVEVTSDLDWDDDRLLEIRVYDLDESAALVDEKGKPVESTEFDTVLHDKYIACTVKTIKNEPLEAVKRALLQLRPAILAEKKDVLWADIGC